MWSFSEINKLFNKWLHTHYYILRTGKRTCVSGMLLCEIQLIIAKKCGIFVDYTGKNKTGMQKKQQQGIDHKRLNSNTTADEFCLLESKEMNKHHASPCRWKKANILLFMPCLFFIATLFCMKANGQGDVGHFIYSKHWTGSAKPALDFHPLLSGIEVLIVTHQGSIRLVEVWDFLPYRGAAGSVVATPHIS